MDDPGTGGHTLLSLHADDAATLDPTAWHDFYTSLPAPPGLMHEGMLPFRVAQLYRLALEALGRQDTMTATAALGVMAHYVGDACQPLHVSRFHDGRDPKHPSGVHSAYEDKMLDAHRDDLITGLDAALRTATPLPSVTGHQEAAHAVVELMRRTIDRLDPGEICDAWPATPPVRPADLWQQFGERTIACIADGCQTLANSWTSVFTGGARSGASGSAAVQTGPGEALQRREFRRIHDHRGISRLRAVEDLTKRLPSWHA